MLQVEYGRERQRTPLKRSNYPQTSYNVGAARPGTMESIQGRGAMTHTQDASPRYDWQITVDKYAYAGDTMSFDEETHKIPRFGASELRGVGGAHDGRAPVAMFNLADEYRTNTSRGFKFVRGTRPSSSFTTSTHVARTTSTGSNKNCRIGTFQRGVGDTNVTIMLPESSVTDYATRDLTDVSNCHCVVW